MPSSLVGVRLPVGVQADEGREVGHTKPKNHATMLPGLLITRHSEEHSR